MYLKKYLLWTWKFGRNFKTSVWISSNVANFFPLRQRIQTLELFRRNGDNPNFFSCHRVTTWTSFFYTKIIPRLQIVAWSQIYQNLALHFNLRLIVPLSLTRVLFKSSIWITCIECAETMIGGTKLAKLTLFLLKF